MDRRILHIDLDTFFVSVEQALNPNLRDKFETINRRLTLKEASDSDEVIFTAVVQLLTRALSWKKNLVRLIGVGVAHLTYGKQLPLLDKSANKWERLNKAVDRIREKYGFTSIQTGRTLTLKEVLERKEIG